MAPKGPKDPALQTNMEVDYVIVYRFANAGTTVVAFWTCFDGVLTCFRPKGCCHQL
jgi:hypothetical protein